MCQCADSGMDSKPVCLHNMDIVQMRPDQRFMQSKYYILVPANYRPADRSQYTIFVLAFTYCLYGFALLCMITHRSLAFPTGLSNLLSNVVLNFTFRITFPHVHCITEHFSTSTKLMCQPLTHSYILIVYVLINPHLPP